MQITSSSSSTTYVQPYLKINTLLQFFWTSLARLTSFHTFSFTTSKNSESPPIFFIYLQSHLPTQLHFYADDVIYSSCSNSYRQYPDLTRQDPLYSKSQGTRVISREIQGHDLLSPQQVCTNSSCRLHHIS